jgi:hypothetical protein
MADGGREPAVAFGVLGSMRVTLDHDVIELRGAKQKTLLAALLLRAGEAVQAVDLREILWEDDGGGERSPTEDRVRVPQLPDSSRQQGRAFRSGLRLMVARMIRATTPVAVYSGPEAENSEADRALSA